MCVNQSACRRGAPLVGDKRSNTADPRPSILPAVLILTVEATVHGAHQEAEQTTEQGLGQEIPVKFSHLHGVSPDDGVSWSGRKERRLNKASLP